MTALAAARKTMQVGVAGVEVFPWTVDVPLKANAKVYVGGFIAVDSSGYGVDPTAAAGLTVVGRVISYEGYPVVYDNTGGADGAITARVSIGIYEWNIGTAGDALTQANAFQPVYLIDDQTVGAGDGGATARSLAGIFVGLNEAGTQARVLTIGALNAIMQKAGQVANAGLVIDTIAAAGAISLTSDITLWSLSGTQALTLANGTKLGQRKKVLMVASGSTPVGSIVVATPRGFATITAASGLATLFDFLWTATGWLLIDHAGTMTIA